MTKIVRSGEWAFPPPPVPREVLQATPEVSEGKPPVLLVERASSQVVPHRGTRGRIRARIVIAFAMVYVLWGSTYLAMRVAVQHMGPALMGGTRFLISGSIMLAACVI